MTDFRFATGADTEALVTLINAAFSVEKFFKIGERTDLADVRAHLGTGRFLLLEDEHGIAGCIYIELRPPAAGETVQRGYLGMLSVNPARQRNGIGSRLMAAGEEFLRERGCHLVDISVVDLREELPGIYAKLGYQVTGSERFPVEEAPVKLPCSFILMSKELGHNS